MEGKRYVPRDLPVDLIRFDKFVERKMRTWFRMVDVSRDGCMGRDDFQIVAERFVQQYHLDDSRAQEISDWLVDGWDRVLEDDPAPSSDKPSVPLIADVSAALKSGHKITEEEFVQAFGQLAHVHPELAKSSMKKMVGAFFEIFDVDKDDHISKEEMEIAMRCFGFDDIDRLGSAFLYLTGEEGKLLSREDYINVWVDFILGPDRDNAFTICFAPHVLASD